MAPLLRALSGSRRAYLSAAERTQWKTLSRAFRDAAERRRVFAEHLREVGPDVEPSRSVLGALRTWWMSVRDRLSEDDHGMLTVLEQADEALLDSYREVLAGELDSKHLEVLLRLQESEVREDLEHVSAHRRAEKAVRQA